jgi:hypothetical protein
LRDVVQLQFRDLRRECASRWWDGGVRERRIQMLLGHSTLLMTQRYLQLPEGDDTGNDVAAALGWQAPTDRADRGRNSGSNYAGTTREEQGAMKAPISGARRTATDSTG